MTFLRREIEFYIDMRVLGQGHEQKHKVYIKTMYFVALCFPFKKVNAALEREILQRTTHKES